MSWHSIPKDDSWKQVTLAHIESLGQRLWISCHCGREKIIGPSAYAAEVRTPMSTPLLAISLRLRCTACGEKRVHVRPEPYAMGRKQCISGAFSSALHPIASQFDPLASGSPGPQPTARPFVVASVEFGSISRVQRKAGCPLIRETERSISCG